MNKYGISEAKSRVGFKTYSVGSYASPNQTRRSWLLRGLVMVSVMSLVFSGLTPSVFARNNNHDNNNNYNHKIDICHRTNSHQNPYTLMSVDSSSILGQHSSKHGNHNGPVWYPGIQGNWGDIIPPFDYWFIIPLHYDGKNWNEEGQEIWNNDCQIPREPTTGQLTLVKQLAGDGSASVTDWTLTATKQGQNSPAVSGPGQAQGKVEPGTYELDEVGDVEGYKAGQWSCTDTNTQGQGKELADDNEVVIEVGDDVTCVIINTYNPTNAPKLHFIKVVCESYSDVAGNADADNVDATGNKYSEFSNYNNGNFTPSPLVDGYVNPSEIPQNCYRQDGWNFKLATDLPQTQNVTEVGPTVSGEFVTPISGEGSALTEAQQAAIVNGQLWISEVQQDGYGFAAIRCYDDALNGDNLEYISLGNDEPSDIYCIAYNIDLTPDEDPCQEGPAWASSVVTSTQGKRKDGSDVIPGRSDTSKALGAADWVSGTGSNFYSLGFGGTITLKFSGYVIDTPGDDLSFHEGTNGNYPDERLSIDVSQDGSNWYTLSDQATNTDPNHVSYADFNESGYDWIQYVRLTDISNSALFPNDADGYDLDAVDATQQVCEPPVTEKECQVMERSVWDLIKSTFVDDTKGVQCSISGYKYRDVNENGEIDEGDDFVQGWEIYLNDGEGCSYDSENPEPTVTTDKNGYYEFTNLPKGKYYVCERQQTGWDQILPNPNKYHEVMLTSSSVENVNFLNAIVNDKCEVDKPDYGYEVEFEAELVSNTIIAQYEYSVSGCKFYGNTDERLEGWRIYVDLNKNGVLDGNEPYDDTNGTGYYKIDFLSGDYSLPFHVREVQQDGWDQIYPTSPLYHEVNLGVQDKTATGIHFRNVELPGPCEEPVDLILNGSFEEPLIDNASGWNIFPSGTSGLQWLISWTGLVPDNYDGDTKPNPANIELHGGVNGWLPSAGNQYAELDSDWEGPSGNTSDEPANSSLTQIVDVPTGSVFKLSFDFSPRPGVASNVMEVYWNGTLVDTMNEDGSGNGNTVWTSHSYDVTGIAGNDTLEFREVGTPDSLGSFLDNVQLVGCESGGGDDSSTSGGGGSGSRKNSDNGRVLGDSTGLPYQEPQVLGASTELPRTGIPVAFLFSLIAILGIVMLPKAAIMLEKK